MEEIKCINGEEHEYEYKLVGDKDEAEPLTVRVCKKCSKEEKLSPQIKEPTTTTEVMIEETNKVAVTKEEILLAKLIPPHSVISRKVEEKDLERVIEDSVILYNICHTKSEFYNGAYATSHPQITKDDPLCFFVTSDRQIIINPVILRHSNYFKDSREACMTFLTEKPIMVPRWQKCEVEFQTVTMNPQDDTKFELSEVITQSLSGHKAFEFQHEIDHENAIYIYPFIKE